MDRGIERLDPYGDPSEPAWRGRNPGVPPELTDDAGQAVLERHLDAVARALGVEPERVMQALRRATD